MPAAPDATTQEAAFAAARRGDLQAVYNLVAMNPALIGVKESVNGWTLLHIFARLSMATAVQGLLKLGADTEVRDGSFRSALHLAARADASPALPPAAATAAAAPAAADAAPPAAPPAAPAAAESRDAQAMATISALLKGGARLTARDAFGLTALHHAAQAGLAEVVGFLLDLTRSLHMPRAPLEAETNAEERALHLAAAGGHAACVRCLLQHNANPAHTNYQQQSALHLAVLGGDTAAALATARELAAREWRLDLNPKTRDGSTPLHLAAAAGHTKMIAQLLAAPNVGRRSGERGVVLEATDRRKRTPCDLARAEGFDDVVALLEGAVAEVKARLARAPAEQEEALQRAMATARIDGGGGGGGGGPAAQRGGAAAARWDAGGGMRGGGGIAEEEEEEALDAAREEAMLDDGE